MPPTVVEGHFEWDHAKSVANRRKHDVSFEEAATALAHPDAKVFVDPKNAGRFRVIGYSLRGRLLTVIQEPRGDRERIITAWKSARPERKRYLKPESEDG